MLQAQIKSMRSEEDAKYAIYEKQEADIKHMRRVIQHLIVKMQELQKSVYDTRRMIILSDDNDQHFDQIYPNTKN
jgi:hypothetical protein